jgi:antitoxin ParD1/3/4
MASEKVSITMASDLVRTIQESVESGEYASASEVVGDAMRLWLEHRAEDAERLTAIRVRIRKSLDDPRPALSSEEARQHFNVFFAASRKARDDAGA